MKHGAFGRLSVEDHKDVQVEALSIEEEILADEAAVEASAIVAEIEKDLDAVATMEVAVESLEGQIANMDALASKPESVTGSVVQMSIESLASTAALLGAGQEDLDSRYQVSVEAAEANPVSSLEVSNEGAKEFLKKVIASIKAIIAKVMNSAKKLFTKLVVAMDGTANKAKKLTKSVDQLKGEPKKAKFSKERSLIISKRMGALLGTENKSKVADFDDVAAMEKGIKINDAVKVAEAAAKAVGDMAGADDSKAKSSYDKIQDAMKGLKGHKVEVSVLENNFNYSAPDHKGELAVYAMTPKATTMKVIEVYTEDKDEDAKEITRVKTLTLDKDYLDKDAEIAVPSVGQIKTMVAGVIVLAKNTKKVSGDAMKSIDALDKALDKMAKDDEGSYIANKLKAGASTQTRDLVTGVILDGVLAYVANTKAMLVTAIDAKAMYGGSEM